MSLNPRLPSANRLSVFDETARRADLCGGHHSTTAKGSNPKRLGLLALTATALLLLCGLTALGSPFANQFTFTQPDGTPVVLWGQGDEFYAVFETLDGYTVVFNQPTQAYEYARLSTDGNQLISSGVAVGRGDPAALGLKPHLRINAEAVQQQVAQRFAIWDQAMGVSQRWTDLKAERQLADLATKDGAQPAPPSFATTGAKLGLTLLIDFSDDVGTVPQAEIINFCNGDSYTGYGNNGSVKKYYLDNSNNQLTYSNVVTIYLRAPLPKTNYNNTTIDCGTEGRALITAAITAMKAMSNYTTTILPTFANLTVDGSSQVVACNVFFAGNNSGVWSYGLWPHSWVLASGLDLGNGKKVYKYQITNIGTSLALGTFCHENGHMLCGFPDIYDYGYDSYGGAGVFCLMGYGGSGGNPVQICAYLKRAAGWATTVSLISSSSLTASSSASGADFNKFYRYAKPGVSTEYYIMENRQKSGRDANLPASGIAIWHIDELGNKDYQNTNYNTTHTNYEVSLIQADNLWHFQKYLNSGDSKDLYYLGNTATGYANRFSDSNAPSARWWDGSLSGLMLHHFSASGTTMTFGVGAEGPMITFDTNTLAVESCAPANSAIDPGEVVTVNFGLKNTGVSGTANLVATLLGTNGVTSPSSAQTYGALTAGGATVSRPFTFTANGSCGGTCTAVFQLQDGTTNLGTISYAFTLGTVGTSASANYSSGGVGVAISDNTTVEVPITITNVGTVADVNVRVRLNHTYDADLVISLVHPDGTVITLANARGSSGDNFGSGATDCTGTFTVFDDAAGTAIGSGTAPFAGSYVPDQLLSTLNGKSVTGTWKLRVSDTAAGDVGTIYCFQLDLTSQSYVCCTGGATNAPPVLAGIEGAALSYVENQPATALTATLTASDEGNLTNATVSLTSGFASGEDVLALSPNPQNGISAAYAGGVLTLTGTTNATSYQTALRSVTYANTSDNPSIATRTVTFTVKDAGGLASGNQSRNITLTAANDPPIANAVSDTTSEDTAKTITLSASDAETCELTFSIVTNPSHGTLGGPTNNFACVAGTPNRDTNTIVYTPATNYNGPDSFTYKVNDGTTDSAPATVTLTVTAVNDPPSFTKGPNQNVLACSGSQSVSGWASNISPGPSDESSQIVDFIVTNNNNGLFSVQPAVSPTGTLTYTLAANSNGLATVTVKLHDNGGTANGGVDTSAAQLFTIMVADTQNPTISCPADVTVWANSGCTATNVALGVPLATNDNCGILLVTNNAPASFGLGTNTVTWTVVDPSGNLATCSQLVIVRDTTNPTISCPADVTVSANSGCTATNVALGVPLATNDNCGILLLTNNAPASFGSGTNTVTWTVVDTSGNLATCTQRVIVHDTTNPTITCPADVTVAANSGCAATNVALGVPLATNDNFGILLVTNNAPASFGPGTNTVTWTVVDTSGNLATCQQQVIVHDTTNPTLTCPADVTVSANSGCNATNVALGLPLATNDNCGILLVTNNAPASFGSGTNTVTWTVVDTSGNLATCSQLVIVRDTTNPTISCPADVTVAANSGCDATNVALGVPVATNDNCGILLVTNNAPASFGSGTNTVTWTVVDTSGNLATCTQRVIVHDTTNPTLTCPADVTVSANSGCNATNVALGLPLATNDNCGILLVTNNAPASFGPGTNTVTWTVVDTSGNLATCTQRVIVHDTTNPTITCPADVTVAANSGCAATNVALGVPLATNDNCGILLVTNNAPASFGPGTNTVTWTMVDTSGNLATCQQQVIVHDTTNPTISCPADVTAAANSGCDATNVALGVPVATNDNCGILLVTNNAPASFGPGTNTVTWTVVDTSGNLATGTQFVIVHDTTNPTISCPADVTVAANSGCDATNVVLGVPVATNDNCGILLVTNNAPTSFVPGTNTVTWTVVDTSGNLATCQQQVIVHDTTNPTISCPADVTVTANSGCDATNVVLGVPVATNDNCGILLVTNNAPASFGPGTNTVTWTAVDTSGNLATCSQLVIVHDTTNPTITCPADVVVAANSGCNSTNVALGAPLATNDNCGILLVTNNAPTSFVPGTNTVTWTAVDTSGNLATCSQLVIVHDTTNPTITCPADVVVAGNSGCNATNVALGAPLATNDNCGILLVTNNAPASFGPGTNTVTWTVVDTSGNIATCEQTVTVHDTTPPVLTCATNKTVECGAAWSFDEPTAVDACSGMNLSLAILRTVTNGDFCHTVITRTWEAIDGCTNRSTCSQTVTITDTTPPVLNCATSKTVDRGVAWSFDEPTAMDACSGTNLTLAILSTVTNGDFCNTIITRTWEATDGCTNVATCSQTVTLTPTTPPVLSVSVSGSLLTLTWVSTLGRTNWVEYNDSLSTTNWIVLTNLTGSGGAVIISDGPMAQTQRFYRVRVQ